jgi:HEPN domain-containing protein
MRDETSEWIDKAEGDMRTARREFAATEWPNYDAVCFHAQQCAEKYLKSAIIEFGLILSRTHDLEALLSQLLPLKPEWDILQQAARNLSSMAVEIRYPGITADDEDAEEALRSAEAIRIAIREALRINVL